MKLQIADCRLQIGTAALIGMAMAIGTALTGIVGLAASTTAQDPPITTAPRVGRRESPGQPQQRQGVDYLAGTWTLTWTGRESAISSGPRTGTVTFARQGAANALTMTSEGKTDAGTAFKDTGTYEWNETTKALAIRERSSGGVDVQGTGDWSSPLSIRFESAPIQVQGQTLKLRRTYSILSAVSFNVVEELSTNGGTYQRLGNAQYVKK
jgi:hypothetical protein